MATWWIDSYPNTSPLFLQVGFPGPHPPYDPVPRYAEPYLAKDLPLLEVTQEELDNQPPAFKELRVHNNEIDHDSVILPLDPTPEQRHRQRAYYLANVTMIDEKLGEIKVGIRLVFQSPAKTLSDEDIQKSIDKILKPIIDLKGVSIPGLEFK